MSGSCTRAFWPTYVYKHPEALAPGTSESTINLFSQQIDGILLCCVGASSNQQLGQRNRELFVAAMTADPGQQLLRVLAQLLVHGETIFQQERKWGNSILSEHPLHDILAKNFIGSDRVDSVS
jgi:hypothetical protein